ncbi:MAG: head completion/stabilization protein [Desulfotalea sp.]
MAGFTGFADDLNETTLQAGTFLPSFDVGAFQKNYRLPASYKSDTIVEHVKIAIFWAARGLLEYQQEKEAEGFTKLSELPGLTIGDEHEKDLLFIRAISCHAKGLLLANYQTMMRKSDGQNDAKESEDTADSWRAAALNAIAQIKGTTSIMVEAL